MALFISASVMTQQKRYTELKMNTEGVCNFQGIIIRQVWSTP